MTNTTHFFLGANSGRGFQSLFPQFCAPQRHYDLLVLKGGPGAGKSTMMKTIGAAMEAVDKWKEGLKQTGRWDVFRKAFMRQAFVLLRVDYKFCGREMRETLKRQIIDYCSGDDWYGFKDIDFEIFKLDARKSGKLRYWGQLLWLKLRKKLGGI